MAQTNAQLWARYGFTGTKGGGHENRVTNVAVNVFAAAQLIQNLIPTGADQTTLLADLDTFMTHLHTASAKISA